mgnify:CR=1 FL=1
MNQQPIRLSNCRHWVPALGCCRPLKCAFTWTINVPFNSMLKGLVFTLLWIISIPCHAKDPDLIWVTKGAGESCSWNRRSITKKNTRTFSTELMTAVFPSYPVRRNPSARLRSILARRNFRKIATGPQPARNSGSVFRRATITTSSEGGMPGRIVQIHEPKFRQTRAALVMARH